MKVGFLLDCLPQAGGGNTAVNSEVELIKKIKLSEIETTIIVTSYELKCIIEKKFNIKVFLYDKNSILIRLVYFLSKNFIFLWFVQKFFFFSYFQNFINKLNIDLLIFLTPSDLVLGLSKTNFIYQIWEFQHKFTPFFPEYKLNKFSINKREEILNFVSINAFKIFFGTKKSSVDFIEHYNFTSSKVVIKQLPSSLVNNVNINGEYELINWMNKNIDNDFIFYPAQYWAHKNHVYILDALENIIKNNKINIKCIFTGSDKGNLNFIKKIIFEKKLNNHVIVYDYLSNEDIILLYKNCLAVVVPTFVGTISFPVIEAFYYKKPVICNSSILDDLYKDKILDLNINDINSLEKNLLFIKNNYPKIIDLVERNYIFYNDFYKLDNLVEKIENTISEYRYLAKRWN